jgi:hypothetical protein
MMHQAPDFFGGGRQPFPSDDAVYCFRGGQVMADRADAAQSLNQNGHLPERTALNKALKSPELDDVNARLYYPGLLVEQDRDLPMTFDPGDRFDNDSFHVGCGIHGFSSPRINRT